jgi:adenine/guanine phosphoribosyltransferase-like PRPP-binding protein
MKSTDYYQSDPNGLFDSIELEDSVLRDNREPLAPEFIEELPEDYELKQITNIRGATAEGHLSDCSA